MLAEDFFAHNDNNGTAGASGNNEKPLMIPVIEEVVSIGKQTVETGKIIVTKQVEETAHDIAIDLSADEYEIKRVAVNEYVDGEPPTPRHEGDTFILPVVKEVLVKRLLVVEELHITKKTTQRHEEQQVMLRKEIVTVQRSGGSDA